MESFYGVWRLSKLFSALRATLYNLNQSKITILTSEIFIQFFDETQKKFFNFDQKRFFESLPHLQKAILKEIVKIWREVDESTVLSVGIIMEKFRHVSLMGQQRFQEANILKGFESLYQLGLISFF